MNELLTLVFKPIILIYVISGMLALGLSQTVKRIIEPLKNVRLTISTVIASYIILPLLAASIARLFGLDPSLRYGIVLFALAAGAEVGPIFTAKSNGNVSLSGGILAMSIVITIIYLPLMLGVFLPDVHIEVGKMLVKLLTTIVAPLLLGLFIRSRFEKMAHRAQKYLHTWGRMRTRPAEGSTTTSTKLWKNGAALTSNMPESHSAENGHASNRRVHHQIGL